MLLDRPTGPDRLKYDPWWLWAVNNLDLLLKPKHSFRTERGKKAGLMKLLLSARSQYLTGQASGAVDLAHVIDLVEDLDFIKTRDNNLLSEYASSLTSAKAQDYSYLTGIWFEVRMAAMFLKTGLQFTRPDPPDFLVEIDSTTIGVECHAPRALPGADVEKRIKVAVEKKGKKYKGHAWTQGSTALLLDATWLVRASGREVVQGQTALGAEFLAGLLEALRTTRYGLVIAFWFGHSIGQQADSRAVSCVNGPVDISDPALVSFRSCLLAHFRLEDSEPIRLPNLPYDSGSNATQPAK